MKRISLVFRLLSLLIFIPLSSALAAGGEHQNIGESLPLYSAIPFAGMLLSIALFPLLAPKFWHHHFGKVSAFWVIVTIIPLLIGYKGIALSETLHVVIGDYVPFIILLGSLYTVSGGILLRGTLRGTPLVNTIMIALGTFLASWMGTTGASMLLIRPFLRANADRKNRAFMVVFFIFLVSNIGGALTPLGDPPLFLGYLRKVPFFWTFKLTPHMIVASAIVLAIYFALDTYFYKKEDIKTPQNNNTKEPLRLDGTVNFIFLIGIVFSVLLSGIVDWGEISILGVHRSVQDVVRDGLLVLMAILSIVFTNTKVREDNAFTWSPIQEVAILFIGIFLTMLPCLKMLQAGSKGELAFIIATVREPVHYFWITGALSSFLDNAPTYLTFLNTALGAFYPGVAETEAVQMLIKEHPDYLKAISASAVFYGAVTYIGNAPNFMVRSIAEEAGTEMPSFFGYMIKYSLPVLIPVFIIITLIFFR